MHIAASDPRFLRREEVTEKDLQTEREIARDQARLTGGGADPLGGGDDFHLCFSTTYFREALRSVWWP